MELATPLQPTVLLDLSTLMRIHSSAETIRAPSAPSSPELDLRVADEHDVDPAQIPLPPSFPTTPRGPSPTTGASPRAEIPIMSSPDSSPAPLPVPPLSARIHVLEAELEHAKMDIAERDETLEGLRRLVDALRGELSSVHDGVTIMVPHTGHASSAPIAVQTAAPRVSSYAADVRGGDSGWEAEERFEEDDVDGGG